LRVKEFNGYARHYENAYGNPGTIRTAGYLWAVYEPHAYRMERTFHKPEMDYGAAWVAKRRIEFTKPGVAVHSYDLFTPDSRAQQIAVASGFLWTHDTAPPAIEYYWADRQTPAWFVENRYDLFYRLEGARKWWARTAEGKWHVIDDGKLTEENGKGPEVEVPRILFATK
jgi:hypothetical protein